MRAAIPELPTPHPLETRLPGVFREDDFTVRMMAGLDGVLAPIFVTLDCLEAYLDPALTPEDFLDWLANWVAIDVGDGWTSQQRRDIVAHAFALHRWRGTVRGLTEQVRLATGAEVSIADSGGVSWSADSTDSPPAPVNAAVQVKVRVPNPSAVDTRRLRELIAGVVPAHVSYTLEVGSR